MNDERHPECVGPEDRLLTMALTSGSTRRGDRSAGHTATVRIPAVPATPTSQLHRLNVSRGANHGTKVHPVRRPNQGVRARSAGLAAAAAARRGASDLVSLRFAARAIQRQQPRLFRPLIPVPMPHPATGPAAMTPATLLPRQLLTTSPAGDTSNQGDTSVADNDSVSGDASTDGADRTGDASTGTGSDATTGGDTTSDDGQDATAGDTVAGDGENDSESAPPVATPVPAPPIPDFASARGAVGDPEHLPLDGGVDANGTYLANWSERRLTWYAVTDPATSCASAGHSEILYVNRSGITQELRDPQLRFSGEVSHFVVHPEQDRAAWVVACGNQLELFVATLDATGQVEDLTLAWLGDGSTSSALVLWDSDEVSLNAIEPDGKAFAVEYNAETGLLSRNGGPSRIMLEAGAPAERSLTPIAASPDGGLTYWTGKAPAGTVSECKELFGSGQSDTLWLRQGEGQWRLAAAGEFPLGTVTAAALDSEALRLAFADVCPGNSGRVILGTQLADGRIGELQEIDLTPFVPGYVAQLFWVDDATLRIETDNTEFGFGTVRFDYRLDQELILQLD